MPEPYRIDGIKNAGTVGTVLKMRTFYEPDPITGRMLSAKCWNGSHEDWDGEGWDGICSDKCACMCHDHRRELEAREPAD